MRISIIDDAGRYHRSIFQVKQRTALLIDLANHTDLTDETSPLKTAFMAVNINLCEYQRALPPDPLERSRHRPHLSITHIKRLRQTFQVNAHDFAY